MFICSLSGITADTKFKRFGLRNKNFRIVAELKDGAHEVTLHQVNAPVHIDGDKVRMSKWFGNSHIPLSMEMKEYIAMEKFPVPKLELQKFGELSLCDTSSEFPKDENSLVRRFNPKYPEAFRDQDFTKIEMWLYQDRDVVVPRSLESICLVSASCTKDDFVING